jgi:hypothetical protein
VVVAVLVACALGAGRVVNVTNRTFPAVSLTIKARRALVAALFGPLVTAVANTRLVVSVGCHRGSVCVTVARG